MQEVNNEAQLEYTAEQIMAAREYVVCIKMGMVIPVDLSPEFWGLWGDIDDAKQSACAALGLNSWSEIVKASGRTGECFLDEAKAPEVGARG